jgi:hypothetical protein
MAAPVADKVLLPLDTGNTGKKVRTQTRVVGADTVHEHFMIPISQRSQVGVYQVHSGILTMPTTATNGTTTGYFWLINPVGSTIKMAIRKMEGMIQFLVLSAVDVSVVRTQFALCTFTGSPSGAQITPIKYDSTYAAPQGQLRTAMTGLTVTLGALFKAWFPPINATASSATIQANLVPVVCPEYEPGFEDDQIILRAGEGIVCYSPDTATTANRRAIVNISWEEFE